MAENENIPPRRNDELLKGVLEDNFADFLRFLYPGAEEIFDLTGKVDFMDKELGKILPNRKKPKGGREADLLARVPLLDGTKKWIIVHTEIEGGRNADFPFRMFQYYYRIIDRHRGDPVEAIAFFTGDGNQPRPAEYSSLAIKTGLKFWYHSYHILQDSEEKLLAMDNVFALVVLACQKSLLEGKIPDAELGRYRLAIAKELLRRGYSHERVVGLLHFLKNFLYVRDEEINRTFDDEVVQYLGGTLGMGIMEAVKKQTIRIARWEAQQEGMKEGLEKGMEKGLKKGRLEERARSDAEKLMSARTFKKMGMDTESIALGLGLTVEQVEKL